MSNETNNTASNTPATPDLISDKRIAVRGQLPNGDLVFMPYDAKAPVTEAGKRTVKIMYKVAKTGANAGKVKGANSCLLLSPINKDEVKANIDKLLPHIINMCEVEQDKIAKELHIADPEQTIDPDKFSLTAVIASLEAEAVSTRMTKEVINSWFDTNLADMLTVLFADKLGISDEPTKADADKLGNFLTVYRNKFGGLASNLVSYQPTEAEKLITAIDKCELRLEGDLVGSKIKEKLVKMVNPVDVTEFLDL